MPENNTFMAPPGASGVVSNNAPKEVREVLNDDDDQFITDINTGVELQVNDKNLEEAIVYDNPAKLVLNTSLQEFSFNDDSYKDLFMGSSEIAKTTSDIKKLTSIEDVFNYYKKEGMYRDVYLPVTNVAIRIYEFNNTDISILELANEARKDFLFHLQMNAKGTQSRKFLDLVLQNAQFLTSDSDKLTKAHFENISAQDIPIIILAAASLLNAVKVKMSNGEEVPFKWEETCPKCGTTQEVSFPFEEAVRAQYTNEMIEWANVNYNPNDTFENNLRRSKAVKGKGVKYTKIGTTIDTYIRMKDPTWLRSNNLDEESYNWIIDKYIEYPYFKEIYEDQEWNLKPMKERVLQLSQKCSNAYLAKDDSDPTIFEYFNDLNQIKMARYIYKVEAFDISSKDVNGKPVKLVEEDWNKLSLSVKLDRLALFDDEVKKKINDQIEAISNYGIQDILAKFPCVKEDCKHMLEVSIDPIALVFSVLQNTIENVDSTTSTQ